MKTYTAQTDVTIEDMVLDLTGFEETAIEKHWNGLNVNESLADETKQLRNLTMVCRALIWVLKRRTDISYSLAAAQSIPAGEALAYFPEPEKEPGEQGKGDDSAS